MGDFEKFLKDNKIQKQVIAEYLGVSRTFVTQLSQGVRKLPEDKLKMIKENTEWDTSSLEMNNNSGILIKESKISGNIHQDNRRYYSDSPDVLRAQIEQLERLIAEKEERLKEKDAQIKEKDAQIKEKDAQIKEKDAQINKLLDKIK